MIEAYTLYSEHLGVPTFIHRKPGAVAAVRGAFFSTYPGLRAWQLQHGARVRGAQEAKTRSGLVRRFEGPEVRITEGLHFPIQGNAAEVLLASLARIRPEFGLCLHVHDEIVLQVAEARVAEAREELAEEMRSGFLEVFPEGGALVRDLVEAKSGPTWADTK